MKRGKPKARISARQALEEMLIRAGESVSIAKSVAKDAFPDPKTVIKV